MLQYCFCFMFWFFDPEACGILAPWPRIKPTPPAFERWSLNHWTPQGVLIILNTYCQITFRENNCCSVTQLCPTLYDPTDCSTPDFPILHRLPELAQTHVQRVSDAIQPSHPLSSPSPPAFKIPQHQGLFQWVSSSHQVAKVLKFQLQRQSFQWIFRT